MYDGISLPYDIFEVSHHTHMKSCAHMYMWCVHMYICVYVVHMYDVHPVMYININCTCMCKIVCVPSPWYVYMINHMYVVCDVVHTSLYITLQTYMYIHTFYIHWWMMNITRWYMAINIFKNFIKIYTMYTMSTLMQH